MSAASYNILTRPDLLLMNQERVQSHCRELNENTDSVCGQELKRLILCWGSLGKG